MTETRASEARAPRDWDAATYDRVADAQEEWGREVLERLDLRGDEIVLDAGCGSGRVTRLLAERLPHGRVIGVDASASMIEKARETLGPDAELILSDLLGLRLPEPVDAAFSNATFHWVMDHDLLFERLFATLRPGGRLIAQCGGEGNVEAFRALVASIAIEPRFAPHFTEWAEPLNFASPRTTTARLAHAGFVEVECWLEDKLYRPADPRGFLASVCLGAPLERLPAELHDPFIDAVLERAAPVELDYVRLNIAARRPQSQ